MNVTGPVKSEVAAYSTRVAGNRHPSLVCTMRTCYMILMRIIAQGNLTAYGAKHSDADTPLRQWINRTRAASWKTAAEVHAAFPKAKVLNGERVRFQVAGGNYRLIVAFDFERGIAFVKFIGTHAEYDRVDALTVSLF